MIKKPSINCNTLSYEFPRPCLNKVTENLILTVIFLLPLVLHPGSSLDAPINCDKMNIKAPHTFLQYSE